MKLYRRKNSPYWWWDGRSFGKKRLSTKCRDRRLALDWIQKYIGENHLTSKKEKGTVDELIFKYLEWSVVNHTKETYARNKRILDLLSGHLGSKEQVHEIKPDHIEAFKAKRASTVKASTVNRDLNTIRHLFSMAVEWKSIYESPATHVRKLRAPKPLPKFYSEDEIKKILSASSEPWKSYWQILLNTGMRRGELMALRWADIKDDRITVRNPKEGHARIVPVSVQLASILEAMPKTGEKVLSDVTANALSIRFKRLTADLGIGGGLHTLRHSVATHLLIQGVPIQVVQKLLGHSSMQTTSIYAHAIEKNMKDAVEKIVFAH